MTDVVRYELDDNSSVLVEVDDEGFGLQRVSRGSDGILEPGRRLAQSLDDVRQAADTALKSLTPLSPRSVELEFGIKLTGEAGALIAKTSAEGHFTVKLVWSPSSRE